MAPGVPNLLIMGEYLMSQLRKQITRLGAVSLSLMVVVALSVAYVGSAAAATATNLVCTGCVGPADIATGAVRSSDIYTNTITAADIATGGVGAAEIATGAVAAAEIATGAVTTAEILDGTIAAVDVAADIATQAELDVVNTAAGDAQTDATAALADAAAAQATADAALPLAGGTLSGQVVYSSLEVDQLDDLTTVASRRFIFGKTATAAYEIDLATPSANGLIVTVVDTDGADTFAMTVGTAGAETINGAATAVLADGAQATYFSYGGNWFTLS